MIDSLHCTAPRRGPMRLALFGPTLHVRLRDTVRATGAVRPAIPDAPALPRSA